MEKEHTEITASKLLAGSQKIDQMKSEIKQIISMIFGLINKNGMRVNNTNPEGRNRRIEFENEEIMFNISIEGGFIYAKITEIDCWVKRPHGQKHAFIKNAEKFNWIQDNSIVSKTHSNLDFFVNSLFEYFPELQEKLDPYIQATSDKI